jgi:hypothetical protein
MKRRRQLASVPCRVCALCGQPIRRGHKFTFFFAMIRHRVCTEPTAYRQTEDAR